MSAFDNDVGRDYARTINMKARDQNACMKERERLITLMGKAGWVIYEARREEGSIALKNAPIIKTIRRATSTTLEID